MMLSSSFVRARARGAFVPFACAALAVGFTAGCQQASQVDVKAGELGNGGFTFSCDDGAACAPYSHEASTFPSAVSLSSTFDVNFKPRAASSGEPQAQGGITLAPVGDTFFTRGPAGFVAVHPGYGTIAARDSTGKLVDYIVMKIVEPDVLTIYDADAGGASDADPPSVDLIEVAQGDSRSFRVLPRGKDGAPLAGKVGVKWTSDKPDVAAVQSLSSGLFKVAGKSVGSAVVTIDGAALRREINVVVTQ